MLSNLTNNELYNHICLNFHTLSPRKVGLLLQEMQLNSLSQFVKTKFSDSRSVTELKQVMTDELKIPGR